MAAPKSNENKELNDIIIIGLIGAVAYFGVISPILKDIGLQDTENDDIANNQINIPDLTNPFSYNWGYANAQAGNLPMSTITATIDYIADNAGSNILGFSTGNKITAAYAVLGDAIYHSMDYILVDSTTVKTSISQVICQYEIWQISVYLTHKYNVDLWDWIKHGQSFLPSIDHGLSHDDLANIVTYVNQLPLYYPPGQEVV